MGASKVPSSVTITRLSEFIELVRTLPNETRFYRGQQDATLALRPSIGRDDPADSRLLAQEQLLLKAFKDRAVAYLQTPPATTVEWLLVARHHGVPTRLLDWTLSPLVAAFFACEQSSTEDSAVWFFAQREFWFSDASPLDPWKLEHKYVAVRPRALNPRFITQRSVVTVHRDPTEPFVLDEMCKVTIPWTNRPSILREIVEAGVDRSVLFPGLDGIGSYVTEGFRRGWGSV
jgi:hypothetical protein